MKLNKEQFKQFILEEVKKLAVEEGWIDSVVEKPVISEVTTQVTLETINEEPKIEILEVKRLAEEFSRMKELVDFRRPLLSNENQ